MRIISVFLCILIAISSVFATEPFLFSTYSNTNQSYYQRSRTVGQEWRIGQFENAPLFFHTSTSIIYDFAPKLQYTRRYSAELGTQIVQGNFSSTLYAGVILEQKLNSSRYLLERNIVPTATINSVWNLEKTGFFQSFSQVEGTGQRVNAVRYFQKFAYGYPINDTYKFGPYISAKFERGTNAELGAGVFLAGHKIENNEIIPSIGVEYREKHFSYVFSVYTKRVFTSLIPDFLEHDEDEPRQWYSGPFKITSHKIKKAPLPKVWIFPEAKKISPTVTRYTMPILMECTGAQMTFSAACRTVKPAKRL